MKDRLIITISDVQGTRAFNVHQVIKKLIIIIILAVVVVIGASFWFISELNTRMDNLKEEKEKQISLKEDEIKTLVEKEKKLQAQNQFYSLQIKGKVKDIEALSSKLDHIEEMIGLKGDKEKEQITAETLRKMSPIVRMYMLTSIPSGSPLKETRVTSPFGYRIHPVTNKKKFHRGIDLKAARRTTVYATADGVVSYVQTKNDGDFGRVIKIRHNFGFETIYAHLYKVNVNTGDVIRKNQEIGLSGNSGRSTAPHLHYEVRSGLKVLDPKNFISWELGNYNSIFTEERRVQWESLVKLINEQFKMVQP
ncbi:peptidase M24 [Halarcobacter ebronensis]|uniref:Peptidase M24 n=1 Tax=Halarcobacter ebronensis TaxID=1462615 RepID=A0A4Q1ARG8_9BACT|nr:M23 family metallopeptidase [Halarcobacter ebronensis]QKF81073.1 zinc metallopeptidase, M23 family [Halarcobacter ebronensis]RXJ68968.1 peptidase M24 [Halarcobacter ebronensis]RXK06379.1 peptidase M24 [Halarcobacter ebronensis]